jgi:hypothetical protein
MKISEYVAELEKIREEHGDLEVEKTAPGVAMGRVAAEGPCVRHRLILPRGERKPRFWFYQEDDRKGEKVVDLG